MEGNVCLAVVTHAWKNVLDFLFAVVTAVLQWHCTQWLSWRGCKVLQGTSLQHSSGPSPSLLEPFQATEQNRSEYTKERGKCLQQGIT